MKDFRVYRTYLLLDLSVTTNVYKVAFQNTVLINGENSGFSLRVLARENFAILFHPGILYFEQKYFFSHFNCRRHVYRDGH